MVYVCKGLCSTLPYMTRMKTRGSPDYSYFAYCKTCSAKIARNHIPEDGRCECCGQLFRLFSKRG